MGIRLSGAATLPSGHVPRLIVSPGGLISSVGNEGSIHRIDVTVNDLGGFFAGDGSDGGHMAIAARGLPLLGALSVASSGAAPNTPALIIETSSVTFGRPDVPWADDASIPFIAVSGASLAGNVTIANCSFVAVTNGGSVLTPQPRALAIPAPCVVERGLSLVGSSFGECGVAVGALGGGASLLIAGNSFGVDPTASVVVEEDSNSPHPPTPTVVGGAPSRVGGCNTDVGGGEASLGGVAAAVGMSVVSCGASVQWCGSAGGLMVLGNPMPPVAACPLANGGQLVEHAFFETMCPFLRDVPGETDGGGSGEDNNVPTPTSTMVPERSLSSSQSLDRSPSSSFLQKYRTDSLSQSQLIYPLSLSATSSEAVPAVTVSYSLLSSPSSGSEETTAVTEESTPPTSLPPPMPSSTSSLDPIVVDQSAADPDLSDKLLAAAAEAAIAAAGGSAPPMVVAVGWVSQCTALELLLVPSGLLAPFAAGGALSGFGGTGGGTSWGANYQNSVAMSALVIAAGALLSLCLFGFGLAFSALCGSSRGGNDDASQSSSSSFRKIALSVALMLRTPATFIQLTIFVANGAAVAGGMALGTSASQSSFASSDDRIVRIVAGSLVVGALVFVPVGFCAVAEWVVPSNTRRVEVAPPFSPRRGKGRPASVADSDVSDDDENRRNEKAANSSYSLELRCGRVVPAAPSVLLGPLIGDLSCQPTTVEAMPRHHRKRANGTNNNAANNSGDDSAPIASFAMIAAPALVPFTVPTLLFIASSIIGAVGSSSTAEVRASALLGGYASASPCLGLPLASGVIYLVYGAVVAALRPFLGVAHNASEAAVSMAAGACLVALYAVLLDIQHEYDASEEAGLKNKFAADGGANAFDTNILMRWHSSAAVRGLLGALVALSNCRYPFILARALRVVSPPVVRVVRNNEEESSPPLAAVVDTSKYVSASNAALVVPPTLADIADRRGKAGTNDDAAVPLPPSSSPPLLVADTMGAGEESSEAAGDHSASSAVVVLPPLPPVTAAAGSDSDDSDALAVGAAPQYVRRRGSASASSINRGSDSDSA